MKYLQIKPGFSIKIDEIVGVEDTSESNNFKSNLYMKNGKVHRTGLNYQAVLGVLEKGDLSGVNKFTQHNVG